MESNNGVTESSMRLAAQAWCEESTKNKVMDTELAMEFAKIIEKVKKEYSSKPWLGNATTSELIYELSARCNTGSIEKGGNYKTVNE